MKSKKIVVTIIMLAFILFITNTTNVQAANYPFTFTVNPEETNAKPGDTVTIDLGIADIDQSSDGINAIQGNISYDDSVFESVDIVEAGENWTATFNQLNNSELKGRFVINNMNSVKTTRCSSTIKG